MYVDVYLETRQWDDPYWTKDPNDSWDRPDSFQELTGIKVHGIDQKPEGWRAIDTDLDVTYGDDIYVVIAVYSTGDTFGRDDGQVQVMEVFEDATDAYAFASWLRNVGPVYNATRKDVANINNKYKYKEYYIPWNGYFESLSDIEVRQEVVRKPLTD